MRFVLLPLAVTLAAPAQQPVDFARDVQPIFQAQCYSCHQGPSAMAGLRLDDKASTQAKKGSIVDRLTTSDKKLRMPFGLSPLPPDKIALIRAWIDQGAPWPDTAAESKHWAYAKPVRPAIPKVRNETWVRNPIDAFILARLEKEDLEPAPEAPKETLIRRVSLDLTGLPPTLAELDEFLADTRPDAFERLVDRLLASPHYGERWARPWLDLARYADTNGYEADRRRSIWKYRDWVINALNADMPFDRFTIEQIAGDMLPSATNDQIIATGFHRNTMFNEEGGVDKEEAHWLELVDRVNTTGTVWLGSTIGCAQCHNHKFDPFTQKEYFQLLAFFNNGEMETKKYGDTSQKFIEPVLDLATPEQAARRDQIEHEIEEIEERAKTPTPALEREQRQWEKEVLVAARDWKVVVPTSTRATATLTVAPDGSVLASGENPARDVYEIEARSPLRKITAIRLEALPHQSLPKGGPGRDMYGNFFLKDLEVDAGSGKLCFTDAIADNGRLHDRDRDQLWIADASREDQRLPRQLVLLFDRPVEARNLRIRMHHETNVGHQGLGRFRLSVTAAKDPERIVKISHKLRPVLESSQRTEEQVKQLQEYFLTVAPSLQPDRDRLKALRQELEDLQIPTTLVLRESPSFERPSAVIRVRGNFLEKGDLVYAGVPAALHRLPATEMPNRLGLARWLVSRDNPLTSRVAVNRFWEQILGRGIVETAEDFGTQGEKPTHPELLDWLAVEFMDRGWSMKAIHRLIVTSATYRQSSKLTRTLQQRDPLNKLLARAPRFRVEAEMVRDIVLAASGLLSRTIGGPSVFPPQPEGIWDLPYNDDKWVPSEGEDRYRRGLYTFMRRTAPYPSFLTFDAGSREICTVRRPRTNTPLQALTTLNDPAFFEAAEALGRLISKEGVEQAFRRCTSRRPTAAELERIRAAGLSEALVANVLLNLDEALTKE